MSSIDGEDDGLDSLETTGVDCDERGPLQARPDIRKISSSLLTDVFMIDGIYSFR